MWKMDGVMCGDILEFECCELRMGVLNFGTDSSSQSNHSTRHRNEDKNTAHCSLALVSWLPLQKASQGAAWQWPNIHETLYPTIISILK